MSVAGDKIACCDREVTHALEQQVKQAVQVASRVAGAFSEVDIREAMQLRGDGVEVLEISVQQEVQVPLRELPGVASDYSADEGCERCLVKRYQLRKAAADLSGVDVGNVELLSIARRALADVSTHRRRLGVSAEIAVVSDPGQDLASQPNLAPAQSFSAAFQVAAAALSPADIAASLGMSVSDAQGFVISEAELAQVVPSAELSIGTSFNITLAPASGGDLGELSDSVGSSGLLLSTVLQVDPSAVETVLEPQVREAVVMVCPEGTVEEVDPKGTYCVEPDRQLPSFGRDDVVQETQSWLESNHLIVATACLVLAALLAVGTCKLYCDLKKLRQAKDKQD